MKRRVDVLRETVMTFDGRKGIRNPAGAAAIHQCDLDDMREQFRVMLLTIKNNVIEDRLISIGSLSASVVHPREILKPAILASASGLILYHNHPSGDPTPSREDIEFTRRFAKCCDLIGIEMLDHLVVARGHDGKLKWISLVESGFVAGGKQ